MCNVHAVACAPYCMFETCALLVSERLRLAARNDGPLLEVLEQHVTRCYRVAPNAGKGGRVGVCNTFRAKALSHI